MTVKFKPMFRIRRFGEGQYRFELTGESRETLLYGVLHRTIKEAIRNVKVVRRVAQDPDRIQMRKLNRRVFLLVTDPSKRTVAISNYYRKRDQAEEAAKLIRKTVFDAVRKIQTGRDGEHLDEYPDIETELKEAFKFLDRAALSQRLVILVDSFGLEVVTTGLENIVNAGGLNAPRAASVAAFLVPPPMSVEQTAASSEAVSTRVAAAHALPSYADTAERERLLISLLADPDPAVAFRATVSAESMLNDTIRAILRDMSSGHTSVYVREEAARILAP